MERCDFSIDYQSEVLDVLQCIHLEVQKTAARYREELSRAVYATPTTFLEMLSAFFTLVKNKQIEMVMVKERFEKGLAKLEETAQQVALMQQQLQELQPVLQATSEEVRKRI